MKGFVCLVFLVAFPWSGVAGQGGGKIEVVGPAVVDFGTYKARERKVGTFKIRNAGTDELRIRRIHKTCGCATASCTKTNLNAGEEAAVEVVILPDSIFGAYAKTTYLESSDPVTPWLGVTVKGTAVPLVEIKPEAFVYAGRIETNKPWVQSFRLAPTEAGVKLGKPEVKSDTPVEAVLIGPDAMNSPGWRLDVKVLPSAISRDLQCSIGIPVLAPPGEAALAMGVAGKIGTELIAFPGTFRLPVSREELTRVFHLRLLGDAVSALDPATVKLPDRKGVICTVAKAYDGRSIEVKARFSPDFTAELFAQGKIELDFAVPSFASARVVCLAGEKIR